MSGRRLRRGSLQFDDTQPRSHYKSSHRYVFITRRINSNDLAQRRHGGRPTSTSCQLHCVGPPLHPPQNACSPANSLAKIMNTLVHYGSAGEFIHSPAKVGNISQTNQCSRVHLCPPNHPLMATINYLPTASASNTVAIKVKRHTLYSPPEVLQHGIPGERIDHFLHAKLDSFHIISLAYLFITAL